MAGIPFPIFPPKLEQECAKPFYVVVTGDLCEFERICATGNAPMWLETILCEFGQIRATGNAVMLVEMILREFGQICATGNAAI